MGQHSNQSRLRLVEKWPQLQIALENVGNQCGFFVQFDQAHQHHDAVGLRWRFCILYVGQRRNLGLEQEIGVDRDSLLDLISKLCQLSSILRLKIMFLVL